MQRDDIQCPCVRARVCVGVHTYVDGKQYGLKYLELMEERQVVLMYE